MTSGVEGLPADLASAARQLFATCHLTDVRPVRIFAEVLNEGRPVASLGFIPRLEFIAEPGQFSNRFAYTFNLNDAANEPVAVVEFALVLDWTVPDDFTPDRTAADYITSTTGYFAAFPYARELLQSLTMRLGIDPVVLGALNRDNLAPTGVTIALRPVGLDEEPTAVSAGQGPE